MPVTTDNLGEFVDSLTDLKRVLVQLNDAGTADRHLIGPAAAKVKAEPDIRRSGKKCKREEEEEEEDDDDSMTWACEVAAMRLLKKCKKETLVMLCNDFGIPTSGNKEKLAEEEAEQMHYETDSDSGDDDQ